MPQPDIPTHFIRRFALIGLAMLVAWPVRAQPAPPGQAPPNAVSVEQSAIFDVTPVTGTLKETVRKQQELVWRARRKPKRAPISAHRHVRRVPAQRGTG